MDTDDDKRFSAGLNRRRVLQSSAVGLLTGGSLLSSASPVGAQEDDDDEEENGEEEDDDEEENGEEEDDDEEEEDDGDIADCEGAPTMSRTSVTTPNSVITQEDPAVVEANFRPDPAIPDDCTIIVDLEFSFSDAGFQWGGGAEWDQATSDLVVGQFEVRPGEIRDIRGELHTQGAEEGDSVTVVADYEIWFEGHRDQSVQQSGIRHTVDVEDPNPPDDEGGIIDDDTPGFGIVSGLAGIGGIGYLINKRFGSDEE